MCDFSIVGERQSSRIRIRQEENQREQEREAERKRIWQAKENERKALEKEAAAIREKEQRIHRREEAIRAREEAKRLREELRGDRVSKRLQNNEQPQSPEEESEHEELIDPLLYDEEPTFELIGFQDNIEVIVETTH